MPEDTDQAADLLEAAFFSSGEDLDQATVDLSGDLPLIEGYKLLRLLGEGGFGMVYEAEQKVPIRRRVALKVLRPGCATRELLARFEQERQALALMNHPHIAKIYDAGETEDARPFIAMELVRGSTIDRHSARLPQREKVRLMREVCRAVAHAHHKGLIHRDLKPSNILITDGAEGRPEPRVIDFGIAKALDGPLVTKVMFTQMRQVVGTPGYMSPERQHTSQISHSADTRTDVFALGAILWELLTGRTPVQLVEQGQTRVILPEARAVSAELRWITEKATDADMDRRYANADALADDLDAWLDGHPLKAGPRSVFYIISKWAARHRVAAVALLALLLTVAASLFLLVKKNRQVLSALAEARASHMETERRAANESYLNGMARERRRPLLALAGWAQALRHDPAHQGALGMSLATLRHRGLPMPAAPTARLPEGRVRHLAVSRSGEWAAMILDNDSGGEILARVRRGEAQPATHPIPADGRMTLLTVSDEGTAAVAAPRGPVGLLQGNGTWTASEDEPEGLRGIAWNSSGELWMIGILEVARCTADGRRAGETARLPDREMRHASSADGRFLAVGIAGGRILVFEANGQPPRHVTAPIPAPFSALAVSGQDGQVAAAWRSGEVWTDFQGGQSLSHQVNDTVLHLAFMPDAARLMIHSPAFVSLWSFHESEQAHVLPLPEPLKTVLPAGGMSLLMQSQFGRPTLLDIRPKGESEVIPGYEGRIQAGAALDDNLLVIADEERRTLDWLTPGGSSTAHAWHDQQERWLALTPSADHRHWFGVLPRGAVCSFLPGQPPHELWQPMNSPLRLASISADGQTMLADEADDPGVSIFRQGARPVIRDWPKPSALALSPDGRLAALGFPGGEVRVYDTTTGSLLQEHDWRRGPVTAVCFIGVERIAVGVSSQARVWQWREGAVLPTPIDLSGDITALAPCSLGRRLAATGDDGTLHLIDVETGRRVVGQISGPARALSLAWEPGDTHLWAFGDDGRAARLAMPPFLATAPSWLPAWIEQRAGIRVDSQGRPERVILKEMPRLPDSADARLKSWLTLVN